jgi:hypothetical protein
MTDIDELYESSGIPLAETLEGNAIKYISERFGEHKNISEVVHNIIFKSHRIMPIRYVIMNNIYRVEKFVDEEKAVTCQSLYLEDFYGLGYRKMEAIVPLLQIIPSEIWMDSNEQGDIDWPKNRVVARGWIYESVRIVERSEYQKIIAGNRSTVKPPSDEVVNTKIRGSDLKKAACIAACERLLDRNELHSTMRKQLIIRLVVDEAIGTDPMLKKTLGQTSDKQIGRYINDLIQNRLFGHL